MAIRQDNRVLITLPSIEQFNTSSDIRSYLLSTWIAEPPQCKYRYFVETLSSGARIYLERPGRLNKGCDFVIFIENLIVFNNGIDKPPKLDFLIDDLSAKKNRLTQNQWKSVMNAIQIIYNAGPYSQAIRHIAGIPVHGLPYETVLKLTRWFFIEQDITYWAKSGRAMLFNAIGQI